MNTLLYIIPHIQKKNKTFRHFFRVSNALCYTLFLDRKAVDYTLSFKISIFKGFEEIVKKTPLIPERNGLDFNGVFTKCK